VEGDGGDLERGDGRDSRGDPLRADLHGRRPAGAGTAGQAARAAGSGGGRRRDPARVAQAGGRRARKLWPGANAGRRAARAARGRRGHGRKTRGRARGRRRVEVRARWYRRRPMTREEVLERIRAHLATELEVDASRIEEGTRFKEDLE